MTHVAALVVKAVLARQNILISGGIGTGKTTLLSILANFIPEDERILVVEDTAGIQVHTPNLVRFEPRAAEGSLPAYSRESCADGPCCNRSNLHFHGARLT